MTKYRYTETDLITTVANSVSVAQVLRKLGIKMAGGSHTHLSQRIRKLNLDTSHFTGQASSRGRISSRRLGAGNMLIIQESGGRRKANQLRRALLEVGRSYKCELCSNPGLWNNQPITLEIDHINGDWLDNRPVNLRFLCPNCHSQLTSRCVETR